MKGITTDILKFISDTAGDGMLLALYFAIIVFGVFISVENQNNDKNDVESSKLRFRNSIAWPGLIMLLGVFFGLPVVQRLGIHVMSDDINPRYAWILLVPVVIGIAMALWVKTLKGDIKKCVALVLLVVLIFCIGHKKYGPYLFYKTDNLYKFPQSVVDISEKCLSEVNEPRIVVPVSSSYPFRQLSTDIKLLYGEDAGYGRIQNTGGIKREIATQMETSEPDLFFIVDQCRQFDCDYIVLDCIYMEFGGENINDNGYTSTHTYIGDRIPIETESDGVDHSKELSEIEILNDGMNRYWDLSELGLEYEGTYGQYLLYRFK